MYGEHIGHLAVDVLSDGVWVEDVWSLSGQQQVSNNAIYNLVELDLSTYSLSQVRLRATAIGNFAGDIAIDNIELWSESTAPAAPQFNAASIVKSFAIQNQPYIDNISSDATDSNGDTLSFSKVSGPTWLVIASDGGLSGTPSLSDSGDNSFVVEVSDGDLLSQAEVVIVVKENN